MSEALADARAAFLAGEYTAAAEQCERMLADDPDEPHALDLLGEVRWMECRIQEGVSLRERAYAGFCRSGDRRAAADAALWLMVEYANSLNAPAVANGWFLRAERLLDGLPESRVHVELEVSRARRAPDPATAEAHFERALEIARALGSVDAEVRALTVQGMHRVARGDVDAGNALLDEAMAAVLGGEVTDPWTEGSAYCMMLAACDAAGDWPRALQWCRDVVPLAEQKRQVPLWAWCRSVYGTVLTATGEWEHAERELVDSLRTLGGPGRPMAGSPVARLAELRIRQGRYEEAERLLEPVEGDPRAAATAVGLLLARGRAEAAASSCERRLERIGPESAAGADLLALLADARVRTGDLEGAADAVARLFELARTLARQDLVAAAELVAADISLARGDGAAVAHLETALDLYGRLGMPLEAGRARLGLARALAGEEQHDLAVEEARRALRAFERLGARPDADAAAAVLRDLGVTGRSGPRLGEKLTAREAEVLELLGEGLSNAQIAERLVISPKTAEHHVGRILRKLDLSSRAEAAAHSARALSARAARSD